MIFSGCLPYSVDPLGFLSMTAQTLSRDNTFQWSSSSLRSFSSDPIVKGFSQVFLEGFQQDQEHNLLSSILYDCAKHEKVELFNIWVETLQVTFDDFSPVFYSLQRSFAGILQ